MVDPSPSISCRTAHPNSQPRRRRSRREGAAPARRRRPAHPALDSHHDRGREARPCRRRPLGDRHFDDAVFRGAALDLRPRLAQRDRFILSKGHCSAALYSTLRWRVLSPSPHVADLRRPLSALNGHPEPAQSPGAWSRTPVRSDMGCRSASAARSPRGSPSADWRTFVVLGDGELQEGSNGRRRWPPAPQARNLVAIVDRNRLQQGAKTEDTNRARTARRKMDAPSAGTRSRSTVTTTPPLYAALSRRPSAAALRHRQHAPRARASRS